jgi:hypothetical protein
MNASWQDIEPLLDRLERLGDPAVRETARSLVALLLELHGDALARMVEKARQAGHEVLLEAWKDDEQVNGLLLLHGLHPDGLASRVRRALAGAAPVAAFLGVEIAVLQVSEKEVRLALKAGPHLTAEALAELRTRVEAAILDQAPEIGAVRFEEIESAPGRIGLPLVGGG